MYKALSAPITVQVEVSSRCPNRCVHCYNFWRKDNNFLTSSDLTIEEIGYIVRQLARHRVFHIVLTGGEPLMNKKALFSALEIARENAMTVSVNSCLIPLTRNDAVTLKDMGVALVLTSIMAPSAETHDRIAQRSGAFTKTLRGIRFLQEVNVPVSVNMVVTQENKGLVAETARFVKSLGIPSFNSTRAGCPGNCSDFSNLSLTLADFREYLETLHMVGLEENMRVDALESYPLCGIREVRRYDGLIGRRCSAGITTLTIASDGSVRPCSHLDIGYGNLLHEDLADVWGKMSVWRTGSLLPRVCQTCPILPACGGGCRMEAKMKNGSFDTPDPYVSERDREYVLEQLVVGKSEEKEVLIPERIRLNSKLRLRAEHFGGVAFLGTRRVYFLNRDGFVFLGQLRINEDYDVASIVKSESQEKFLRGLIDRNIVSPV